MSLDWPRWDALLAPFRYEFFRGDLAWPWLASYVIGGMLWFRFGPGGKDAPARGWRESLAYCFPKRYFLTPSARVDYKLYALNYLLLLPLLNSVFPIQAASVMRQTQAWISWAIFGIADLRTPVGGNFWGGVLYAAWITLALDFGFTFCHLLFHRVPWLWKLHRVHHSASELNIFTTLRFHPIELVALSLSMGGAMGAAAALARFALGYQPVGLTIFHLPWLFALYQAQGLFRHSHMMISFGALSYVFVSPAMHKHHHSRDPEHYGKNFAHVFSLWDYLLGTLHVPEYERLPEFGLNPE